MFLKINTTTIISSISIVGPVALGIIAFYLVVGPLALDPTNLAWMQLPDIRLHYFSWELFRNSPWSFPLGLNPSAGMELSSSIIYTDPLPLFAFLFKPFSSILPIPFQYFGIWTLLCFIFQGLFSWALVAEYENRLTIILFSTLIFLFSPTMFLRIGNHTGLVSHFLILAAIYLNLNKNNSIKVTYWTIILALSLLIQSYIFVMALALCIADILDKARVIRLGISQIKTLTLQLFIGLIILFLVFWQGGFLEISSSGAGAGMFGTGRMNLLSPFDARNYSYLLPPIFPTNQYVDSATFLSMEGFNYLGLGVIFLIPLAIMGCIKNPQLRFKYWIYRHIYFLIAIFLLFLFALSNKVGIGNFYFEYPVPYWIEKIGEIFRNNGRFFWPALYMICLLSILIICRTYSPRASLTIVVFASLIQIVDTSIGWIQIRESLAKGPNSAYADKLVDPLWMSWASTYRKVSRTPSLLWPHDWDIFADYASRNKMQTNSLYFSRVDPKKYHDLNIKLNKMVATGEFDSDTLYIFDHAESIMAASSVNQGKHFFGNVDGYIVLAPNWCVKSDCSIYRDRKIQYPKVEFNQELHFNKKSDDVKFLEGIGAAPSIGGGWSFPEEWGTWSEGRWSKLTLPIPKNSNPTKIIIKAKFIIHPALKNQVIQVYLETLDTNVIKEYFIKNLTISSSNGETIIDQVIEIPLAQSDIKDGILRLKFKYTNPVAPNLIGLGTDTRKISIGLVSARFE